MDQPGSHIGFIGLGVMGEPMCRNLAQKSGRRVIGLDRDPAPMTRLQAAGVIAAASLAEVVQGAEAVLLSLPSGEVVDALCREPGGLLELIRPGQVVVDLSTSPVGTTRELAREFEARGAALVDAPVARTRAAAESGTLAVMVGASEAQFARVRPLIACFATDITLCGTSGCGQVVKILNNMVLFETVVALSEAKLIGERAGVDPALLFDTLSKGSADSFALRNHGLKAIVPGEFPERAFPVTYAHKDLRYALQLARETGVESRGAGTVDAWFEQAIEAGVGERYFPVISTMMGKRPSDE